MVAESFLDLKGVRTCILKLNIMEAARLIEKSWPKL